MAKEEIPFRNFMPEGWEGKYPPCQIYMDQEGKLFGNGAPMIHQGIIAMIFNMARRDDDGVYFLEQNGKRCQLEVADTFFVVTRVDLGGEGASLVLNDGGVEALDPASLRLGDNEVIYCRVKGGAFPARFNRQAYYQLAENIEEYGEGFGLRLGSAVHPL